MLHTVLITSIFMKGIYSLLLLAFGLTSGVWAQDCQITLSGQILTSEDNKPLAYASIQIKELNQSVLTDSTGRYELDHICPGTYTIVCDHVMCDHMEIMKEVMAPQTEHNFYLEAHIHRVQEVEILGEKVPEVPTQAVASVTAKELDLMRGVQLGDALAKLPGINILKTGPSISKPIIHGLHSNRILILNNGIRQEGQQWGSEHAPEIDPFIATQLTVIKGSNSLRYGPGAMAGVILVEPAPIRLEPGIEGKLHLVGSSNGRQGAVSGHIEGRSAKDEALSWRVQGTGRRGGNFHTPDYYLENTGLQEFNTSATLSYQKIPHGLELYYSRFDSKIGILSPAHLGGASDLERALASPTPLGADTVDFTYDIARPYQRVIHHLAKMRGYKRVPGLGKISATYAFQYNYRREFDKHRPRGVDRDGKDKAELDFQIYTHTLELVMEGTSHQKWETTGGVSGIYQNNFLTGRPFIPNYVLIGGEAFVIERLNLDNWEFEAGLRYDYRWLNSAREIRGIDIFTIQTFQNVSGSVGALYQINKQLQARINIGRGWRAPHVNELYSDGLHHGAGAVERGDSTLVPEAGIKSILSFTYNDGDKFQGDLSIYHHSFQNFIYKKPGGIDRTIRGTFPLLIYTQTQAQLTGADISLSYQLNERIQWEGKGSYLRAWNVTEDEPLVFMPANRFSQALSYTIEEMGRWKNTFLKVSFQHVLEQKNIPFDEDPEARDWLPPPPAYSLWGLQAGSSLGPLELSLTIDNLLNIRYRDYLNRFRYYADELGRNITLRANFSF